jgi:hypothetical protein
MHFSGMQFEVPIHRECNKIGIQISFQSKKTGPEEWSTARQWPWQPKHAPTTTLRGPSLGNRLLNMSLKNGGILESGDSCSAYAEAT